MTVVPPAPGPGSPSVASRGPASGSRCGTARSPRRRRPPRPAAAPASTAPSRSSRARSSAPCAGSASSRSTSSSPATSVLCGGWADGWPMRSVAGAERPDCRLSAGSLAVLVQPMAGEVADACGDLHAVGRAATQRRPRVEHQAPPAHLVAQHDANGSGTALAQQPDRGAVEGASAYRGSENLTMMLVPGATRLALGAGVLAATRGGPSSSPAGGGSVGSSPEPTHRGVTQYVESR